MSKKKIQCQICGQDFTRITASHLTLCSPGISLEEYRRIYGATSPGGLCKSSVAQYAGEVAATVVERIANDEQLLADIASRVGQHLFSDNARGKVLGTAMMMLAERSESYRKHVDRLQQLDDELFMPHRIEAGGPDGSPTDTLTLLQMARYQTSRVNDVEHTLLRLLKSAIDDRKTQGVNVNVQQSFSGLHEQFVVPTSFDPKQREALRRLGSRLIRSPQTVKALIDKVKDKDEQENEIIEADFDAVDK